MTSTPIRRSIQAAVVATAVIAAASIATIDKSVTLTVDGQPRTVHFFGSTVADLLAREGIKVGQHDLLIPGADTSLSDGQAVALNYGRKLTITVDGEVQEFFTTARTVDAALLQLGLTADGAELSVSRALPLGRTGLSMSMVTPKSITLDVGGTKRTVESTALTVSEALLDEGLTLGELDKIKPAVTTEVTEDLKITLTRIVEKKRIDTKSVAYKTTRKNDSSLYKGTTETVRSGKAGSMKVTYVDTYVNGKKDSSKKVSSVVTKAPRTAIVSVGTKSRPAPQSTSLPSVSGGLNWAALARCESGGNPRAVNPAGYYGLYQFSIPTWRAMGMSGNPADATPATQTAAAQKLYNAAGRGQWPYCGRFL